jgi:hypothetical protein
MGKPKTPSVPPLPPQAIENMRKKGLSLDEGLDLLKSGRADAETLQNIFGQASGLFDEQGNVNQAAVNTLADRIQASQAQQQQLNELAFSQLQQTFGQQPGSTVPDVTAGLQERFDTAQGDLGQLERERLGAALRGELDPSSGLLLQEQRDFDRLVESAGQQGIRITGDNLESATSESTAGNQLLQRLRESSNARRDAERQSIIGQATQANLARTGQVAQFGLGLGNLGLAAERARQSGRQVGAGERELAFQQAQSLRSNPFATQLGLLGSRQSFGPQNLIGSAIGLGQGFGGAAQPFINQRNLEFQRNIAKAQESLGKRQSLFGLGGALAGGFAGIPGGPEGIRTGSQVGFGFGTGLGSIF